jgi:hypothetical protein
VGLGTNIFRHPGYGKKTATRENSAEHPVLTNFFG